MTNSLELSERQRATIAAAITILSGGVIVLVGGGLLWLIGVFVARFSQVFLPLAVAAVLALVLRPYYQLLRRRLSPGLAVAAVLVSMLLPILAFGAVFAAAMVDQVRQLVDSLPALEGRMRALIDQNWPRVTAFFEHNEVGQQIRDAAMQARGAALSGFREGLVRAAVAGAGAIGTLLSWAVLPVYFAFLLKAEPPRLDQIDDMLPFLKRETRDDVAYLVREFVLILVSFFRGQLIVAGIMGILFAIGFSVVGLRFGAVLGLALGLLNVIPYLGSVVGLSIGIPLALFQENGGWVKVLAILVVFVVVQCIEGYVLTPRIMGQRTGLHPLAIIVAVFFWGSALNGIAGMMLAIPLTAFLVVFWRLAREKYIRELV